MDLLIVDDESSLRDFLSIVFEDDGWRAETAASLAEGRAILQKDEPDLVLCDLMLPDGSGLELLREIKAQNPSIAVIMITAHTSTKSAVEALKAGAFDYIAKPFDIEELKIIVRKAVDGHGQRADRQGHPLQLRPPRKVRIDQLRRAAGEPARVGAVRSRAGRLHRCDSRETRPLSGSGSRHDLPR